MGVANDFDVRIAESNARDCTFRIKKKATAGQPAGYAFDIVITKYPTGNCQLSSIAYMNQLFQNTKSNKADILAIIHECYRLMGYVQKLVLVDVQNVWIDKVEKCLNVMLKNNYVSSNGSQMCLFVVNLKEDKNGNNNY